MVGDLAVSPGGVLLPRREVLRPNPGLLLPGAQQLLRRPLERWKRHRTMEDALVAAASLDASLGTKAQSGTSTASLTTSAAAAANSLIVVGVGYFAAGGSGITVNVTTAAGLTWASTARTNSGSVNSQLWYAYAAAGLASSSVITWTASASTCDWMIGGASFLGMNSTPTPLATNGAAASAQPWSSGSIVAGAVNLGVVAAFEDGSGTATSTSTAPLTELIDFASLGQTEAFTLAYDLASASTATLAGSWSASLSHAARGAAFPIAAGAAAARPPRRRNFMSRYVPRSGARYR
jgi:hypothetical protein